MKRLQVGVACFLLLVGTAFLAWHFYHHTGCASLDGDAKVGAFFAGAGLLCFPFGLPTAAGIVGLWRQFKGNGQVGPPSAPNSP